MRPKLKAGDVFCSQNLSAFSRVIVAAEKFWARDGVAEYGHAGIITSVSGDTFEALGTIRADHMAKYSGSKVLIARPVKTLADMPIVRFSIDAALWKVREQHEGQRYPLWRLALHLVPPSARRIGSGDYVVCSELTAKYLRLLQTHRMVPAGLNPDDLADAFKSSRCFDIVYEGEWK